MLDYAQMQKGRTTVLVGLRLPPVPAVTPKQLRAARGLIDWSQGDVAAAAGLGLSTVRDFEKRRTPYPASFAAICAVVEAVGVEFLDELNGVRLRPRA